MWEIFLTTVNAVLPIVLLIVLGYALGRAGILSDGFLKTGNKLVFNVFLPCMLFINVYDNMNSFADIRWDVALYCVIIIFIIFALGLVTAVLTTRDGRRRGVILQCAFRSNFAIIGLTLVARLGGDAALAGIVSAFSIPLFNVLAVISLTVFAREPKPEVDNGNTAIGGGNGGACENDFKDGNGGNNNTSADNLSDNYTRADEARARTRDRARRLWGQTKHILKGIVTNPLIIGVALGVLFVGIREIERAACGGAVPFQFKTQLKFLYVAVSDLKAVASPFALVVLGGQFRFSAVRGMTKEILVGTLWRVILAPLLGVGAAVILSKFTPIIDFGPEVYPTLIALFATPVAVSSAIMAGNMGGDGQLGTQYVVWTSLASVITIFALVFILMSFGLVVV